MEGASVVGGFVERAEAAQQAGCDMLLMCNDRDAAINVIDNAKINISARSQKRLRAMLKPQSNTTSFSSLHNLPIWLEARKFIDKLTEELT